MDKLALFLTFLLGIAAGSSGVLGYMYLADDSPLMSRQKAFDDISIKYVSLAKKQNSSDFQDFVQTHK